jgi:uncharacterized protein (TIGR02391 family)
MDTRIVLKVHQEAALAALTRLVQSGEQLLERSPFEYYDNSLNRENPHATYDVAMASAARVVREGAATWCVEAQTVLADIFDGFNLPESVLIGHNKMFPRVSVLRTIIARVESDSTSVSHASVTATHPAIAIRCHRNFQAGHYEDAVFDAFKALENEIRAKVNAPLDEVGAELMKKAMNPSNPKLTFSPVSAEQESVYLLFRGAMGFLKNPLSHRFLQNIDERTAAEAIAFASLLMRLVERSESSVDNSAVKSGL